MIEFDVDYTTVSEDDLEGVLVRDAAGERPDVEYVTMEAYGQAVRLYVEETLWRKAARRLRELLVASVTLTHMACNARVGRNLEKGRGAHEGCPLYDDDPPACAHLSLRAEAAHALGIENTLEGWGGGAMGVHAARRRGVHGMRCPFNGLCECTSECAAYHVPTQDCVLATGPLLVQDALLMASESSNGLSKGLRALRDSLATLGPDVAPGPVEQMARGIPVLWPTGVAKAVEGVMAAERRTSYGSEE